MHALSCIYISIINYLPTNSSSSSSSKATSSSVFFSESIICGLGCVSVPKINGLMLSDSNVTWEGSTFWSSSVVIDEYWCLYLTDLLHAQEDFFILDHKKTWRFKKKTQNFVNNIACKWLYPRIPGLRWRLFVDGFCWFKSFKTDPVCFWISFLASMDQLQNGMKTGTQIYMHLKFCVEWKHKNNLLSSLS